MQELIGYFGYGSLVNRDTLGQGVVSVSPARLRGWRRHWQSRGIDDIDRAHIALLSVHRHAEGAIDGMVIVDLRENLGLLDQREARYERIPVDRDHLDFHGNTPPDPVPDIIYIYVGRQHTQPAPARPSLLQSYLDTVLAGYLREYGERGIEEFLASTIGFDSTIICDREAPHYSRAVQIPTELANRFDTWLLGAGARFA